jgi:hypothetical protein
MVHARYGIWRWRLERFVHGSPDNDSVLQNYDLFAGDRDQACVANRLCRHLAVFDREHRTGQVAANLLLPAAGASAPAGVLAAGPTRDVLLRPGHLTADEHRHGRRHSRIVHPSPVNP